MMAEQIGSNRLVFIDHEGEITIINEDDGVMFQNCWLSNTYAWSSHCKHLDAPEAKQYQYPSYWGKGYYSGSNLNTKYANTLSSSPKTLPESKSADSYSLLLDQEEDEEEYERPPVNTQFYENLELKDVKKMNQWELTELCFDAPDEAASLFMDVLDELRELEQQMEYLYG